MIDKPRVSKKKGLIAIGALVFLLIGSTLIGAAVGLALAGTANIKAYEEFETFSQALPTKILDTKGRLITEFSSSEKRELVTLEELPRHLILAVVAREDQEFFHHHGFSVRGIVRAFVGVITKRNLGGGSTITQQVAGTLYADRNDKTITRKIRELWWALQIERRFTKNEILELYLNKMYMGAGTYGVEAASKYYFGHSAREITVAEAGILVIQFSSPARYNPLDNPNVARNRQQQILARMVSLGYVSQEEADASFQEYWDNYDYTRVSSSAFLSREDRAPWFSEYVRRELTNMLYGTRDLYRDGYVVHTTLDLDMQAAADKYMSQGLRRVNAEFKRTQTVNLGHAVNAYLPIVDLLSLVFDLEPIHATASGQMEAKSFNRYIKRLNPVVDMMALLFDLGDLKSATNMAHSMLRKETEQSMVEGALVTIENETGYIRALVGGSKYDQSNQLIRATQAKVMPGSAFKPLYYSAAIDSGKFTATSIIYDSPTVFNHGGIPYVPNNYGGVWQGAVPLWLALAQSYNIPALKVLDGVGFDQAISRSAALLGIEDKKTIRSTFPRVYPLGLGIIAVSPLQMARAYAIFANQGREVSPIAIRSVEDRNGQVILDPEKELRLAQRKRKDSLQIISPQNAYVMSSIMKRTLDAGLMSWATARGTKFDFIDDSGKKYRIEAAGKTGTTQNWADGWSIGYTPYYTTSVWMGFDRAGNSLGTNQTGSMIAAPVWADYMREVHQGLPAKSFPKPASGIIEATTCRKSGLLMTEFCNEGAVTMPYLMGTQPTKYCNVHGPHEKIDGLNTFLNRMEQSSYYFDSDSLSIDMPVLDLDFLNEEPHRADRPTELGNDFFGEEDYPYESLFGPLEDSLWPSYDDSFEKDSQDSGNYDDFDGFRIKPNSSSDYSPAAPTNPVPAAPVNPESAAPKYLRSQAEEGSALFGDQEELAPVPAAPINPVPAVPVNPAPAAPESPDLEAEY